jgi:hypothetical protein
LGGHRLVLPLHVVLCTVYLHAPLLTQRYIVNVRNRVTIKAPPEWKEHPRHQNGNNTPGPSGLCATYRSLHRYLQVHGEAKCRTNLFAGIQSVLLQPIARGLMHARPHSLRRSKSRSNGTYLYLNPKSTFGIERRRFTP